MPPCFQDEEGLCVFTRGHASEELRRPFQLTPGEREAWSFYKTARALSGFDSRGLPILDNLTAALDGLELHLKPGERRALLQRVAVIHNRIRRELESRLAQDGAGKEED